MMLVRETRPETCPDAWSSNEFDEKSDQSNQHHTNATVTNTEHFIWHDIMTLTYVPVSPCRGEANLPK